MKWGIVMPWLNTENLKEEYWLDSYVDREDYQFSFIPRSKKLDTFHSRKSKFTSLNEWMDYWRHSDQALKSDCDGIITSFPQLPAVFGLQQNLSLKAHKPIVAWCFAIGTVSEGKRQLFAKWALKNIDKFVVVTRREIEIYSKWLDIPVDRFEFVPQVEKPIPINFQEEKNDPFITSQGSAHRDFKTFFKVIDQLKIKTIVASGPAALKDLEIPPTVETPMGISRKDCWELTQKSRFSVVPMHNRPDIPAAGIVTIVEAMMMGKPVISTRCNGAEDYIVHGETGFLVEPGSEASLREAVESLWYDDALRQRMSAAAQEYAHQHFSYEAGAAALLPILDEVAKKNGFS